MHIMSNTSEELPCPHCGGPGNIIRQGPNNEETRVKCYNNSCNFTYSKADSLEAKNAGAIPDSPPQLDDPNSAPTSVTEEVVHAPPLAGRLSSNTDVAGTIHVPRTPVFVFITKKRDKVQFSTKKDLKKMTLQWETAGRSYEVFQLTPKKVSAKIEIL